MSRIQWVILVGLIVLQTAIHIAPFLMFSQHPLGYDTGFYRRYLIQEFKSFPNTSVPGLGSNSVAPRVFLDIVGFLPFSTDTILYGSYVFLHAVALTALFFLVRQKFGLETAIIASLLFTISPVQYTAYWYMFFKQAFAMIFLFLALWLIDTKSVWAFPMALMMVTGHTTTTIIFLLTLGVFLFLSRNEWKKKTLLLAATLIIFLYLNHQLYFLKSPVAVFMNLKEFLMLTAPLLLPAIFGLKRFWFKLKNTPLGVFAIIAAVFPLAALPFYERVLVFTDIAVILLAAVGFIEIKSRWNNKIWPIFLIAVSFGWFGGNFYNQILKLKPVISEMELHELENIKRFVPARATIFTSTQLAPWVQGWSVSKVVAPGMLGEKHKTNEWVKFWTVASADEKKRFLKNLPRPLYLFFGPEKKAELIPLSDCLAARSDFIFEYRC